MKNNKSNQKSYLAMPMAACLIANSALAQNANYNSQQEQQTLRQSTNTTAQTESVQQTQDTKQKTRFFGSVDTAVVDSYNPIIGFRIGEGWANQTTITIGLESLLKNKDSLSVFTWLDTDLEQKTIKDALVENDYGINYSFPAGKVANGDVVLNASLQYWKYWSGLLGEHDTVTDFGATWNGPVSWKSPISLNAQYRHLFPRSGIEEGDYIALGVSKQIPLKTLKGVAFSFTPEATAAWSRHFFQNFDAWTNFRALGTLKASKNNWEFRVGAGYQFNIDGDTQNKPNKPIFLTGITYNF